MKRFTFTLNSLITVALFLMPNANFAQAPDLGNATNFAAFTAAGAFNSLGTTMITGDIGTDVGAFSGFPPGVVLGAIHVADGVSALAAQDVEDAYNEVAGLTCGAVVGVTLGNGQTLTPNIYCTGAASTLNGNLILDGQGDPDALFIFQIDGAFATSTFSSVTLIGGASLCNVYWQINGEFDLGDFSVFRGTVLVNGAINLLEGSSVIGRVLSRQGAISLFSNTITIGLPAVAAVITASSSTSFCIGGSVTLSGNIDGVWNTGETTPSIVVTTSGEYFVTNITECGIIESNHIIVTVHPLPVCSITGDLVICEGELTELCAPAGLAFYVWSTGATTQCITVSNAGVYILGIVDLNGCNSTCLVTVVANPIPVCSITGDLVICEGESTELCAPPGFSYLWSTGEITSCITVTLPGIYSVTLMDLNGCASTCSAEVTVNLLPVCSITGNLSLCGVGASTELCAPPGAANYLWSTGELTACITVSLPGIYTVTIIDANGCTSTCSVTVVVNPLPVCTITGDLSLCAGGFTELCGPMGMSGYLWSTGETTNCILVSTGGVYTLTVTDLFGCSSTCDVTVTVDLQPVCSITGNLLLCNPGQTTELCAPLGHVYLWSTGEITACINVGLAGIYSVILIDLNGCTSTCSVEVILDPLPACTITGDLLLCDGESTELCVPPGAASYLWSNGELTNCITVTLPGIYTVIITDANGCTSTCSVTVVVNLPPVCAITGDLSICLGSTTVLCGPIGFASYLWSTGELTNCITVSTPGIYVLTVVDLFGCSSTCEVEVIVNAAPVCSITGDLLLCDVGQTTELCAPLGYVYLWSTGEITACINVGLAGIYSVTLIDLNGCTSTCSVVVVLDPLPVCTITGDLLLCDGESTELCVPPGATSYLWSNGATTNCVTVSLPGIYSVIVTQANGCTSTCSVTVVVNLPPVCAITGDLSLCLGLTTELCGPIGFASYSWSTGEVTNCISVSAGGIYTLTVTDLNGCTSTCSVTVVVDEPPVCAITGDLLLCGAGQTTELCAPPGFFYLWSNGEVTACITVGLAGIYSVTLLDLNGCTSTCSVEVILDLMPDCTITGNLLLCEGESTELCVPPGAAGYLWSTGATTNCITVSVSGIYSVIVTEANGCTSTCSVPVIVTPLPPCTITGNLLLCESLSTELCVPAGAASYLWSNGATTNCITVSLPGTYSVVVTQANGCSSTCSVTVTADSTPPVITCPADLAIECDESTLPLDTGTATATDNCTLAPTITFSDVTVAGLCPEEYTITRTWVATDAFGNSSTCVQTITVGDNTPPTIACPENLTVQCAIQIPAINFDFVTATDNCGGVVTVAHVGDVITNQICENNFTLTRTYQATDVCGNTATCVQVITVLDNTPPELTFPAGFPIGDTLKVQCYGQDPEWDIPSFDNGDIQATDNCTGPVSVVFNQSLPSEGDCVDGFINLYRLTWTATDVCGNSVSAFVFLALVDTIPPVIFGVPLDITVNCNEIPDAPDFIYAIDECLCACIVLLDETLPITGCQFGQVIVRTWRATDDCGNQTIATQRITLMDDEAPVIVGVLDTACINDPRLLDVVAIDNCGGPTVLVFQDFNTPNPCGDGNAIRRVYEAYDNCGNVSRDTSILLLNDQNLSGLVFVNPILIALDSSQIMTLEYTGQNGNYTNFGINDVGLEGACFSGGVVTFTETVLETGDCTTDGFLISIELKWTATDVCGNFTELTVIVHVVDDTDPNFVNFIAEMTIGCDEELPENFGTDNSGNVAMTTRDTTIRGDCIYNYDVLRSVTLRDSCGNSTTREQIIHVRSSAPIIEGVEEEICDDLSIPEVTAFDLCAGEFVEVTMQEDTLDVPCSGLSIIRTWTAVGSCDLVTVVRQTIIMNDQTPPEIIVPDGSVILPFLDQDYNLIPSSQVYLIGNLNALDEYSVIIRDDCDQEIIPVFTKKVTYAEDCEAEGYFERRMYTWMATDACGNMTAFSFSVDIMDDLAPEFSFSETTEDLTIICAPLPPAPEVNVVDLAQPGTVTYTETIVPGNIPGTFIVTRTWVATDACGNTSTFVQTITWTPDTFLECEVIVPAVVECNSHGVIITSVVTGGSGPVTYDWEIIGGECFIQGGQGTPEIIIYVGWSEVKIILTVTDAYGCVSMCMIILPCVNLPVDPFIDFLAEAISETDAETAQPNLITRPAEEQIGKIKLWPNPASKRVTLSFESAVEEVVEFSFINMLGQVILYDKINARTGLNSVEIDISLVSEGSHLVKLKTEKELHTKVIVIME